MFKGGKERKKTSTSSAPSKNHCKRDDANTARRSSRNKSSRGTAPEGRSGRSSSSSVPLCSPAGATSYYYASSSSASHHLSSSSSSLSTSSLPYLFTLIIDRQWKNVRKCLNNKYKLPKKQAAVLRLCQERDETNLTCLSLALGHKAPFDIIQRIIEIDPSIAEACDDYGANALHVGCLNGAPLECLEFVVRKYKDLAMVLDLDNLSPLHHAVGVFCTTIISSSASSSSDEKSISGFDAGDCSPSYSKDQGKHQGLNEGLIVDNNSSSKTSELLLDPSLDLYQNLDLSYHIDLIRMLSKASPEMVHAQDWYGITPIDLIQLHKAKCSPPPDLAATAATAAAAHSHHHCNLLEQQEHQYQYEALNVAYKLLTSTSIELYKRNKRMWEEQAILLEKIRKRGQREQTRRRGRLLEAEFTTAASTLTTRNTAPLSYSSQYKYKSCCALSTSTAPPPFEMEIEMEINKHQEGNENENNKKQEGAGQSRTTGGRRKQEHHEYLHEEEHEDEDLLMDWHSTNHTHPNSNSNSNSNPMTNKVVVGRPGAGEDQEGDEQECSSSNNNMSIVLVDQDEVYLQHLDC